MRSFPNCCNMLSGRRELANHAPVILSVGSLSSFHQTQDTRRPSPHPTVKDGINDVKACQRRVDIVNLLFQRTPARLSDLVHRKPQGRVRSVLFWQSLDSSTSKDQALCATSRTFRSDSQEARRPGIPSWAPKTLLTAFLAEFPNLLPQQ